MLTELREPPAWLELQWLEDEHDPHDSEPFPEPPAWWLQGPSGSDLLSPPCSHCTEPDPWEPAGSWTPLVRLPEQPVPPSPVVTGLEQALVALEALDRADLTGLPAAQQLADTGVLLSLSQRLRVHLTARVADVQARRLHELTGARSVKTWAQRLVPDTPAADLTVSKALRGWALLTAAVHGQAVTLHAAGLAAGALERARRHVDRPDGLIDGLPGPAVIAAVVRNTVDLISRSRIGLNDDSPLLQQLLAQTEQILTGTLTGTIGSSDGMEVLLTTDTDKLEAAFLLLAQHIDPRGLKAALSEQLDALLPSVLEDNDRKNRSHLTLERKLHGKGLRIVLDADCELGELLWTCLTAEARRDPANPTDTAAAAAHRDQQQKEQAQQPGEQHPLDALEPWGVRDPDTPRRRRSRGERLADALKNLLHRYLAADLAGTLDKAPVRMTVTVPIGTLEDRPGAPPARGASGNGLPRSLVQRWWCDATVTAHILSRGWIPLGHTHTARTLTRQERVAARLQHGHRCAGRDCCDPDDPLLTLEPHHVEAYASTGTTTLSQNLWACPSLHHDIHHGRTVQLRNGRRLNQHGYVDEP